MTPETFTDHSWWRNGLDGKTWLHDAFAVFSTVNQAIQAVCMYADHRLRSATIYRASIRAKERKVELAAVASVERSRLSVSRAPVRTGLAVTGLPCSG